MEGIPRCARKYGFYDDIGTLVTQLEANTDRQTHGHLFQINFSFQNWICGPKRRKQISVYTATFISQMLGRKEEPSL